MTSALRGHHADGDSVGKALLVAFEDGVEPGAAEVRHVPKVRGRAVGPDGRAPPRGQRRGGRRGCRRSPESISPPADTTTAASRTSCFTSSSATLPITSLLADMSQSPIPRFAVLAMGAGARIIRLATGVADTLVRGQQHVIELAPQTRQAEIRSDVELGDDLCGQRAQFGVGVLRTPQQELERRIWRRCGRRASKRPLACSIAARASNSSRQRVVEGLATRLIERVGQVDVVALAADDRALSSSIRSASTMTVWTRPAGVDEAVTARERPCRRCSAWSRASWTCCAVVRMLMGEQQLGGRHDLARLVAVHAGDLVGPLPRCPTNQKRKLPTLRSGETSADRSARDDTPRSYIDRSSHFSALSQQVFGGGVRRGGDHPTSG